jgi:hypothetical protein
MKPNLLHQPPESEQTFVSLLRDLRDETTTLVRQEIALAKAETMENLKKMGRSAAWMAAGAGLALFALFFILLGVRDLLASALLAAGARPFVAAGLSALIVATATALGGWTLVNRGRKSIQGETLVPEKAIESVKEDKEFIKQKFART